MKKIVNLQILYSISLIIFSISLCEKIKAQKKIDIYFNFIDTLVSCKKKNFTISYKINNKGTEKIKIPKDISILSSSSGADIEYFIEKFNDSEKVFSPSRYLLELIAIRKIKYKSLNVGCFFSTKISLPCRFMEKGLYRMRLKFNVSKFNKGLNDCYSEWKRFRVVDPFEYE